MHDISVTTVISVRVINIFMTSENSPTEIVHVTLSHVSGVVTIICINFQRDRLIKIIH